MATSPFAPVRDQLGRLFAGGPTAGLDEGQLLDRFVAGRDDAAFEAIVVRHGPMVLATCRGLLNDPNDVDDAFQATFLVLARRAGDLHHRDRLGGWLHGVARRVSSRARAQSARRRDRERAGPEPAAAKGVVLDSIDLGPIVHDELGKLPETYRTALVVCLMEGKTHEEAARHLGWPLGTVKGRLARAKDLLRNRLVRRGIGSTASALVLSLSRESVASVPVPLIVRTVEAALIVRSDLTPLATLAALSAISVAPRVVALTQGVASAMSIAPLKLIATVAVAAGLLAGPALSAHQIGGPSAQVDQPVPGQGPVSPASDSIKERMKLVEAIIADYRSQGDPALQRESVKWTDTLDSLRRQLEGPEFPVAQSMRRLADLRVKEAQLKETSTRDSRYRNDFLRAQYDRLTEEETLETLRREKASRPVGPVGGGSSPASGSAGTRDGNPQEAGSPSGGGGFGGGGGASPPRFRSARREHPDDAERDERIEKVLARPISMPFSNETPLEDVLKYLGQSTQDEPLGFPNGLPIYIDPKGLQDADKTTTSPITIAMEGIPLRTTLRLVLDQLDLDYRVRDGLLLISSRDALAQEDISFTPATRAKENVGGGGIQ